jgi:hypothetical protein
VSEWPALAWVAAALALAGAFALLLPRVVLWLRGIRPSPRRKVAMALWREPREGYIHARLDVDAEQALAFVDWLHERSNQRVTLTHLVGKAVGEVLVRVPEFNRTLVWDTLLAHERADLSILVGLDGGEDVDWVKLEGMAEQSVIDVARAVDAGVQRARDKGANAGRQGGAAERLLPVFALRPLMAIAGWYASGLGGSLRPFGVSPRPFGSAVITTAATFGIDEVYDARTAFGHVSFNVVICRLQNKPAVVDGRIEARRHFNLCINADHRVVDAVHLGRALDVLREVLEHPWPLEGLDGPPRRDEGG